MIPAQNGLAMIASAIRIVRDISTAQVEYDQENCVCVNKKSICQICGAECK